MYSTTTSAAQAFGPVFQFFSNDGFMPHLHCYLGKPSLVWTMAATDFAIGLSYTAISLTLYHLVRRIRLPFSMVIVAFGTFIAACGAGHFMGVYNLWVPNYWAAAALNVITAGASVATALWLLRLRPRILRLAHAAKRNEESRLAAVERAKLLAETNARHEQTHRELMAARVAIEELVQERTESLEQTSVRLELALSAAKMGVWDWDLQSGKLEWSDTLKRLFGYELEAYHEQYAQFADRLHPEDRAATESRIQDMLAGKGGFDVEYRVVWPDESVHWIAAQGRLLKDAQGRGVRAIGTATNIDEAKRTRDELEHLVEVRSEQLSKVQAGLAQAAKLSALGEMAGGIAHEINTPLATISLQAEQAARMLQTPITPETQPRVQKKIGAIMQTAHRIAAIIQGLRTFARDADNDPFEEVTVSSVVERSLQLCQSRFRAHNIELVADLAGPALLMRCRPVQIEQILLNLLGNAFDAVSGTPAPWVRIEAEARAGCVHLSVSDSGQGVPAEVAEKIMQPFFTTKEVGKGTGLGLSISNSIAQEHGGRLSLDRTGPHTRFVLSLPEGQH